MSQTEQMWARKNRANRKSARTFRALLHLQTISIASPYRKVVVLSLRERGWGSVSANRRIGV